jgi:hypothetical protein
MGIIQVRTPSGIQKVRIAGDTPTAVEQQAIVRAFSQQQPTETAPEPTLPTRDIDYDTGVQDILFRKEFSKGDNEEEKRLRLQELGVPEDAVQIDSDGEFLINRDLIPDDIKSKYNIEGTGLLAVDEKKGFTKYDFADFYGETRGPLGFGITASMMLSPVGLVRAALGTGLAGALGRYVDEYEESEEGLSRETDAELGRAALGEFLATAGGEGIGRGVTAVLGRIFKGAGGDSVNETRRIAREAISEGASPTLRAANESPILGRLQAIYEGVYPNKKAAEANARFVSKNLSGKLKEAGFTGKSTEPEKLFQLLDRDIKKIYGTPEELVNDANKNLTQMVETEIDKLIKMFGDETTQMDARQVAESVDIAKRIFDEDSSLLYKRANDLLGDAKVVPVDRIIKTLNRLDAENPAFGLRQSAVGKFILKLGQEADAKASVKQINGIRTVLRDAGFDPGLVGTQNGRIVGELLGDVERSLTDAAVTIRNAERGRIDPETGKPFFVGSGISVKASKEGLDLLDKANTFYKKGIGRFKDLRAEKLMSDFKKGQLDPEVLFDAEGGLLERNRGDTLRRFLDTAIPEGNVNPVKTPATFEEFLRDGDIDPQQIISLPDTDLLKRRLLAKFESKKAFANRIAEARGTGMKNRDAVRTSIARGYLSNLARTNTDIYGNINPTKIVSDINALGSTGEELFGDQYKPLISALQDLGTVNPNISPDVINSLAGRPIADQVSAIKQILKQRDELANNALAKGLSKQLAERNPEAIVDVVFRKGKGGVEAIKQAERELGEDTMDAIRQSAMERILRQLPDDSNPTGKEFIENILSGKYSTQLDAALRGYGDETIDAMFGGAGPILRDAVRKSAIASNRSIAGLGALAPASIATSLGLVAFIANPLATLTTATAIKVGAKFLRSKTYLNTVTRPTGVRPGTGKEYDKLGRFFEQVYEVSGQSAAQQTGTLPTGLGFGPQAIPTPPVPTVQSPQQQTQQQQTTPQTAVPNVFTPLKIASPVSPILLGSSPATQQLAQSLGRSR